MRPATLATTAVDIPAGKGGETGVMDTREGSGCGAAQWGTGGHAQLLLPCLYGDEYT